MGEIVCIVVNGVIGCMGWVLLELLCCDWCFVLVVVIIVLDVLEMGVLVVYGS